MLVLDSGFNTGHEVFQNLTVIDKWYPPKPCRDLLSSCERLLVGISSTMTALSLTSPVRRSMARMALLASASLLVSRWVPPTVAIPRIHACSEDLVFDSRRIICWCRSESESTSWEDGGDRLRRAHRGRLLCLRFGMGRGARC